MEFCCYANSRCSTDTIKRPKLQINHSGPGDNEELLAPPIERFFEVLPLELVLEVRTSAVERIRRTRAHSCVRFPKTRQVFTWLWPWDLLSMLETNKQLRRMLMRKASGGVRISFGNPFDMIVASSRLHMFGDLRAVTFCILSTR